MSGSSLPNPPMPPSPWAGPTSPPPHTTNPWPLIVGGGRLLALILLLVGTLIAVVLVSPPGSCYTSSACSGYGSLAATSLIAAKALWVFGLFFLAATSGLRMQGGMMPDLPARLDVNAPVSANLRFIGNLLVLLVSVILLAVLLFSVGVTVAMG